MKITSLTIAILYSSIFSLPALGQSQSVLDIMEQSIRTRPNIAVAEADLQRAGAAAERIAAGPYEYEVSITGGQRRIDDPLAAEHNYTEWSTGISRSFRLPVKKRVDQDLSRLETDLSYAGLEQALHEERLVFTSLWSDWRRAELLKATSAAQVREARQLVKLTQISVDKGAERQIRVDQLSAETNSLVLQAQMDVTSADLARTALTTRYPDIDFPHQAIEVNFSESLLAKLLGAQIRQAPSFKKSQALAGQAKLRARRAKLEKIPDPNFGIDIGNEFGGSETSIMARVTVPIGGTFRDAAARELAAISTLAQIDSLRADQDFRQMVELARQRLRASIALYDNALNVSTSADLVLDKLQRGQELGEVTIPELIAARRMSISAKRAIAEHKASLESDMFRLAALTGIFSEL